MFKNQNGFSLIELMVVVAIIGILSAVAVPQFQKFQRKAKQSEAKTFLSAIYLSEKIFLAEHGTYYPNLYAAGLQPEGVLTYMSGFTGGSTLTPPPGYDTAELRPVNRYDTFRHCSYSYAAGHSQDCMHVSGTLTGCTPATTCVATAGSFLACANGRIGGSVAIDRWTMDHRKELINTVNGAL